VDYPLWSAVYSGDSASDTSGPVRGLRRSPYASCYIYDIVPTDIGEMAVNDSLPSSDAVKVLRGPGLGDPGSISWQIGSL
jgi:hypothetical protein